MEREDQPPPPPGAGVEPPKGTGEAPVEVGGRAGPDPTRYGDYERAGRCIDF